MDVSFSAPNVYRVFKPMTVRKRPYWMIRRQPAQRSLYCASMSVMAVIVPDIAAGHVAPLSGSGVWNTSFTRAPSPWHILHMIAADQDPIRLDRCRAMSVTQMPGDAREIMRAAAGNFGQVLRGGLDRYPGTVFGCEPVAPRATRLPLLGRVE